MHQSKSRIESRHLASGLIGVALGIAIGFSIATAASRTADFPAFVSTLGSSVIAPGVIAIIGAYATASFSIRRQREKEREQERTQWKLRAVSLLQRIAIECKHLQGTESIDDRKYPTAVYQYEDSGPLAHLDELFIELMDHYTEAPPGIEEKWKISISRLKRAYDDPGNHPDIGIEPGMNPTDTRYFKTRLESQVTELLLELGGETEGVDEEQLPLYTADPE
jgi:hypothetical protein